MTNDTFESRRQNDPQGVIDDLIEQTSKQAKEISNQRKKIEILNSTILEMEDQIAGKSERQP